MWYGKLEKGNGSDTTGNGETNMRKEKLTNNGHKTEKG